MTPGFWQAKRVFLTGHTGFKGSWLSLWLQSLGADVTGYALKPQTNPSLFEVANVGSGMHSIIADVQDLNFLFNAIKEAKPEIVIHMAAQPLVRYSYTNPVETYTTNVMGTVNLLESIRQVGGVKAVVNVTSDKCYENQEWLKGYCESDPIGGYDPYSNSKGCAELITAAYRSSFFNPDKYTSHGVSLASARAGNVVGGGDWSADRLIPDFIRAVVEDETVLIRSPSAIRPWQHVLEPLIGYLKLAEALYKKGPKYAQAWNFGPNKGEEKTVEWIIRELVNHWGRGASYKVDSKAKSFHEASFLMLDCNKAKMNLGWYPQLEISETLHKICAWHQAHLDGFDMRHYSLDEIAQFEKRLLNQEKQRNQHV